MTSSSCWLITEKSSQQTYAVHSTTWDEAVEKLSATMQLNTATLEVDDEPARVMGTDGTEHFRIFDIENQAAYVVKARTFFDALETVKHVTSTPTHKLYGQATPIPVIE
jgi:hypothetical protein